MIRRMVLLSEISMDPSTQIRTKIDMNQVDIYLARLEAEDVFPPVRLCGDCPPYRIVDGWHRVLMMNKGKRVEVDAELEPGDEKAALIAAAGSNNDHGWRLSWKDRENALRKMLRAAPEWTDQAIADHVRVSPTTVSKYRLEVKGADLPTGDRVTKAGKKAAGGRPKKERSSIHMDTTPAADGSALPTFERAMEIAQEVFPRIEGEPEEKRDAFLGYAVWNETGFPQFYEGDPEECIRRQLTRYRDTAGIPFDGVSKIPPPTPAPAFESDTTHLYAGTSDTPLAYELDERPVGTTFRGVVASIAKRLEDLPNTNIGYDEFCREIVVCAKALRNALEVDRTGRPLDGRKGVPTSAFSAEVDRLEGNGAPLPLSDPAAIKSNAPQAIGKEGRSSGRMMLKESQKEPAPKKKRFADGEVIGGRQAE